MIENMKYETKIEVEKDRKKIVKNLVFEITKEVYKQHEEYWTTDYHEYGKMTYVLKAYFKANKKIKIERYLSSSEIATIIHRQLNSDVVLDDVFFSDTIMDLRKEWNKANPIKYVYSGYEFIVSNEYDYKFDKKDYLVISLNSICKEDEDRKVILCLDDINSKEGLISDINVKAFDNYPESHIFNKVSMTVDISERKYTVQLNNIFNPTEIERELQVKLLMSPYAKLNQSISSRLIEKYEKYLNQEVTLSGNAFGEAICDYVIKNDKSINFNERYSSEIACKYCVLSLKKLNEVFQESFKKEQEELIKKFVDNAEMYFSKEGKNSYEENDRRYVILPSCDLPYGDIICNEFMNGIYGDYMNGLIWDFEMVLPCKSGEVSYDKAFVNLIVLPHQYRRRKAWVQTLMITESLSLDEFLKCVERNKYSSRDDGYKCKVSGFMYSKSDCCRLSNYGKRKVGTVVSKFIETFGFEKHDSLKDWFSEIPNVEKDEKEITYQDKLEYVSSMAKELHCANEKLTIHFNYKTGDKIGTMIQDFKGEDLYDQAFDFLKKNIKTINIIPPVKQ